LKNRRARFLEQHLPPYDPVIGLFIALYDDIFNPDLASFRNGESLSLHISWFLSFRKSTSAPRPSFSGQRGRRYILFSVPCRDHLHVALEEVY
jgi:hypothetical protein